MYIDSSRIRTYARIKSELYDPRVPMREKRKAHKLLQNLQKQMKDQKLGLMRERLQKAVNHDDKYEIWKITCQIKDYMNEDIPVDIYER